MFYTDTKSEELRLLTFLIKLSTSFLIRWQEFVRLLNTKDPTLYVPFPTNINRVQAFTLTSINPLIPSSARIDVDTSVSGYYELYIRAKSFGDRYSPGKPLKITVCG